MPGAARVGIDSAAGTITGGGQGFCFIDGALEAVVGDAVAPHPPCPTDPVHCNATMTAGSASDFINGKPVCRAGDTANCGHAATGSGWVFTD